MRLRTVFALVATTAVALAAAGCFARGAEETPEGALTEAAATTADLGSYRADVVVAMEGIVAEPVEMTAEGVFDARRSVGHMTVDMSELGRAFGGPHYGEAEMLMRGSVVFLRFPYLQRFDPSVKTWLRIDMKRVAEQHGFDPVGLRQLRQSDPREVLAFLYGVTDGVEEAGDEEVRGVATTRYRATVDLEKVAREAPAHKDAVERVIQTSGVKTVPTDVWVDEEGLVRRLRLAYEDIEFSPGQRGDMTTTIELYDFGVDVAVEAPPRTEVTALEELMGAES